MDFPCVKFMLILALFEGIQSLPLGCPYNGTSYKEGESVRTEEPCLSCVCQKGALECSLRVCAEYPNVLPPACFLVHKPNDCCPQLLCEERFNPTGVELRTGFKLESKLHGNDCVINGSVYAEGSAVASSRVCEYCYCIEGEMKCIKPRCLQFFEGCKAVYEKSSCCPTHYDCRDADMDYLTTQIKNFAKVHPTASSDTLRSLTSVDLSSYNEYFKPNESVNADLIKTDVSENTPPDKINTEQTTVEAEKESTMASVDDWDTTIGLQTTISDNCNEDSTKVALTEATTVESKADVNVSSFTVTGNQEETSSVRTRSEMDVHGGIESSAGSSDNSSSQDADDYDSYDYSEPRLPPSLPNLVIFPFVAADAVVKDESADAPASYENVGIERVDAQPVFYKDYFSPPIKTEGGFVPKEPSKSDESFYEHGYFREQMEPPNAGLKKNPGIQVQTNATVKPSANCISEGQEILPTLKDCVTCTCQSGAVVCQDSECPQQKPETIIFENQKGTYQILESSSSVAPNRLREAVRPVTEVSSDFILEDKSTHFHENYQTKNPVTVTYKNFVVDFYPNYLITTARGHFKVQSVENMAQKTSEENLQHPVQKTQDTVVPLTTTRTMLFNFFGEANTSTSQKTTRDTPAEDTAGTTLSTVSLTTSETSFFEDFVKSFSSKDATFETATTTAIATAKYKYSSKIKGQVIATTKPKQEEIGEKVKLVVSRANSTTDIYSWPNSVAKPEGITERTKDHGVGQKPVKKDDLKQFTKIPLDQVSASVKPVVETKNEKNDFSESLAEANPASESRKSSIEKSGSENTATKLNVGILLKLAGCNIYGMMYRVGKIITELSGPCLECLCTELGVQCRPLNC